MNRKKIEADRKYLSPPAVAKAMAVSQARVIEWIREGKLAAMDVSKKDAKRPSYRITEAALEAFEKTMQVKPSEVVYAKPFIQG